MIENLQGASGEEIAGAGLLFAFLIIVVGVAVGLFATLGDLFKGPRNER
jgi:hypothetical protein